MKRPKKARPTQHAKIAQSVENRRVSPKATAKSRGQSQRDKENRDAIISGTLDVSHLKRLIDRGSESEGGLEKPYFGKTINSLPRHVIVSENLIEKTKVSDASKILDRIGRLRPEQAAQAIAAFDIIIDNIESGRSAFDNNETLPDRPGKNFQVNVKAALPELNQIDIATIRAVVLKASWKPGEDPIKWVTENLGKWIPGLMQSHLQPNDSLYQAFGRLARRGLPDGLDVPTKEEAEMRKRSPEEQFKLFLAREISAERTRKSRASKAFKM